MTERWRKLASDLAAARESAGVDRREFEQTPPPDEPYELTDRDRAMLDFERRFYRHQGAKEADVRELFDLSATRYYQLLRHLVQQRAAVEYAPDVCNRVRRVMTRIPAAEPVYNPPAVADEPTLI